jgi:hypothetical protein
MLLSEKNRVLDDVKETQDYVFTDSGTKYLPHSATSKVTGQKSLTTVLADSSLSVSLCSYKAKSTHRR